MLGALWTIVVGADLIAKAVNVKMNSQQLTEQKLHEVEMEKTAKDTHHWHYLGHTNEDLEYYLNDINVRHCRPVSMKDNLTHKIRRNECRFVN